MSFAGVFMIRRLPLVLIFFTMVIFSQAIYAQSPCPTSVLLDSNAKRSSKLICSVPQVYGPGGMVGTDNGGPLDATTGHEVHFQASTLSSFGPLNSHIGVELSQLPIAAPVAGFVFTGGFLTTTESYGPILSDRAETLGAHRLFVGASYQHFEFDKIDGMNMRNLGIVLTHESEPTVCSTSPSVPCDGGEPIYTRDIIATQTGIDLKVHQLTFVATVGLTDKLDLSLALPVSNVRMGVRSLATIYNFEPPPVNHHFAAAPNNSGETFIDSYNATFTNVGTATGIDDITIRGKYKAWQSPDERSGVAIGLDLRLPTGDSYNFLGTGTWGLRPFVIWSRSGLVSTRASAGFQGNGSSVLAGSVTSQPVTDAKLPDVFSYSAGADINLGSRANISSDFIGQSFLSAAKIASSTYTDYAGGTHSDLTTSIGTVNEFSMTVGGKVRLHKNLLFTANVLFRLNNAGLHTKPVPLAALSYSF
jgi:hypothetical protein